MATVFERFDYTRLNDLDIVEVVRRLGINTKKAGVNYKIKCPWHHPDNDPSLVLYNKENDRHCHCYSCGAHHSVIDLVMELEGWTFQEACQWLSNNFGICTQTVGYMPQPKQKPAERKVTADYTYIPMEMVDDMVSTENSFCRCLMYMAHSKAAPWTPEAVEWATEEYRIGCYALWNYDDFTVFPNIDYQGRVCNLKVQHYDTNPASPRFGHDSIGQSYMLGSMWLDDGKLKIEEGRKKEDVVFRNDSLFGEHLLARYPNSPVALVESPKNAIFGALVFPEKVWVAAGNKHNLKRSVLLPLQGRNVYVYPDRDAITLWTDKLRGMKDLANFVVSDFCLRHAPEDQLKFDIADYLEQKWQDDMQHVDEMPP